MKYYAIVVNKYDKNDCFHYISSDYPSKKDFLVDLRCNGYRVRHNRVYTEAEYDALGLLDKRAKKRYAENMGYCKSYVIGECYCDWGLFCENAHDLYGMDFINKMADCQNEDEVKSLVNTIIQGETKW